MNRGWMAKGVSAQLKIAALVVKVMSREDPAQARALYGVCEGEVDKKTGKGHLSKTG